MTKAEKKQLLIKLLDEGEHGIQTRLAEELEVSSKTIYLWARGKQWPKRNEEMHLWNFLGYQLLANGDVQPQGQDVPSPAVATVAMDLELVSTGNPIKIEVASPLTRIMQRLNKAKALRSFMLEIQAEEESLMREVIRDLGLEPPSASPRIEILRKMRQELTKFVNESDPIDIKLTPIVRQKPGEPKKK